MSLDRRSLLAGIAFGSFIPLSGCFGSEASKLDLPEPLQVNITPREISPGIFALASFSARVLVLSRRDYPLDEKDVLSVVSPTDLAVAWGAAAEQEAREAVELSQADRRYKWRARSSDMKKPGVGDFTRLSGNWHIMPADDAVKQVLNQIRKDQTISIEGELIQVYFTDGTFYKSSLSRDDTGDGACEIIFVRKMNILT